MSPWFQYSYDGWVICNGCKAKANQPVGAEVVVEPGITVPVWPTDLARDLEDVERGYNY